jgi:HEAT repeat protein
VPRAELLTAWQYAHDGWRAYGDGWARVTFELARAVVVHAADTEAADAARAALVYHFDVEVRLDAVMQLGQLPGKDPASAVRALRAALTDGSVLVRREAVTSLGVLGPAAIRAESEVAALVDDPDPQIRARASAALRAIRRSGK